MSLFPAYAEDSLEHPVDYEVIPCIPESNSVSPAQEAQLLASDNDEECQTVAPPVLAERPKSTIESDEYYLDRKLDCGNLRVSTLYYPGRPQYETQKHGAVVPCIFLTDSRKRRYFEMVLDPSSESLSLDLETELAERTKAYRQMLTDTPADESLWLRFIDFQERCRDAEAALSTAESGRERLPDSVRLRGVLYRLRARVLVPRKRLSLLREDLAKCPSPEQYPELATELWLRLLDTVAQCGDITELDATVAAALTATRALPFVYPHILYIYGGYLRSAGLWERLVLLLELVMSMNFPPDVFPPPTDVALIERVEKDLQDTEDKAISSGLPLSTVWVRVERARALAHWRAPPGGIALTPGADPQRTPLPADVAELLLPARVSDGLILLVQVLRLAKVPILPAAGYVTAALDPSNDAAGDVRWASSGEALLSLVRAARRLPTAHPARAHGAKGARALLAHFLDPPHYFTDDAGYLTWVSSLWEASCSWTSGAARLTLLCWRLRWMHSLLLLLDVEEETGAREARRIRSEARLALKRFAGGSPIPFALFARIEKVAAGVEAARRVALNALRAAIRDRGAPPEQRLYVARVVSEVCEGVAGDCAGVWACVCAAMHSPLPEDDDLATTPPQGALEAALLKCEIECSTIEPSLQEAPPIPASHSDTLLQWALLPDHSEWAAARARLAPASRRAELVRVLRRYADGPLTPQAARYWEQSACALAGAAAQEHSSVSCARMLAPLFPHNALLALACSGTSVWWSGSASTASAVSAGASHVSALAHVFPALLRAAATDWQPIHAAQAVSACTRASRSGSGGPLLRAARLEGEARAPRPRPSPALLTALDDYPHHKWLYVRGAMWCSSEAAALADVLLERGLRLHALRDELEPIEDLPQNNDTQ